MARPRILLLLVIFAIPAVVFCQSRHRDDDNSLKGVPLKERIVVGGGLGLQFGSQIDVVSLSPMIGYKLTEKLLAGSSVTYRYTKYKYFNPSIKLTDYGVSPFLRYSIFNGFFLQAEYEYLNYEFPESATTTMRKGFNSVLAGGGFVQPIGGKAAFYVLALYNFSYQSVNPGEYSPYPNPLILRGGITFGF